MPWYQFPSEILRSLAPSRHHGPSSADWTVQSANQAALFCLTRPGPRRPALPLELVLQILAHPTRWLCTATTSLPDPHHPLHVTHEQRTILKLHPLTAHEISLIRKIVFTFRSKDQGWSDYSADHGTFRGSWTWFQLVITPDAAAGGNRERKTHILQRNRHAGRVMENYRIEFEVGDEIVDDLREGDTLTVDACASYNGWCNYVDKAGMEIWSLDDLGLRR